MPIYIFGIGLTVFCVFLTRAVTSLDNNIGNYRTEVRENQQALQQLQITVIEAKAENVNLQSKVSALEMQVQRLETIILNQHSNK